MKKILISLLLLLSATLCADEVIGIIVANGEGYEIKTEIATYYNTKVSGSTKGKFKSLIGQKAKVTATFSELKNGKGKFKRVTAIQKVETAESTSFEQNQTVDKVEKTDDPNEKVKKVKKTKAIIEI